MAPRDDSLEGPDLRAPREKPTPSALNYTLLLSVVESM